MRGQLSAVRLREGGIQNVTQPERLSCSSKDNSLWDPQPASEASDAVRVRERLRRLGGDLLQACSLRHSAAVTFEGFIGAVSLPFVE